MSWVELIVRVFLVLIKWLFCICCEAAQTAPHIVREPDADVSREKAYKEGEDVIMACVANRESNAELVHVMFLVDVLTS